MWTLLNIFDQIRSLQHVVLYSPHDIPFCIHRNNMFENRCRRILNRVRCHFNEGRRYVDGGRIEVAWGRKPRRLSGEQELTSHREKYTDWIMEVAGARKWTLVEPIVSTSRRCRWRGHCNNYKPRHPGQGSAGLQEYGLVSCQESGNVQNWGHDATPWEPGHAKYDHNRMTESSLHLTFTPTTPPCHVTLAAPLPLVSIFINAFPQSRCFTIVLALHNLSRLSALTMSPSVFPSQDVM